MSISTAECIRHTALVESKVHSLATCRSVRRRKGCKAGVLTQEPRGCPRPRVCWVSSPLGWVGVLTRGYLFRRYYSVELVSRSLSFIAGFLYQYMTFLIISQSLFSSRSPCSILHGNFSKLVPWCSTSLHLPYDTWRRLVGPRWEFRRRESLCAFIPRLRIPWMLDSRRLWGRTFHADGTAGWIHHSRSPYVVHWDIWSALAESSLLISSLAGYLE